MRMVMKTLAATLALGFCFSAAGCGMLFSEEKIKKEEVPNNSTWIFDSLYKCQADNPDNEQLSKMVGVYPKIIVDKYVEETKSGQMMESYIVCEDGGITLFQYVGASNQDDANAKEYELLERELGTYDGKEITITGGAFSSNVVAYVSEGMFHIEDSMPASGGNVEYGIAFKLADASAN